MILSINPNMTAPEVVRLIEGTANKQKLSSYAFTNQGKTSGTWNNQVGYGLLDAYEALKIAQYTVSGSGYSSNAYLTLESGSGGYSSGGSTVYADNSGYAWAVVKAHTPSPNATYFWNVAANGQWFNRAYIYPRSNGPYADISVYTNPGYGGGQLQVYCSIYDGGTWVGTATYNLYVQ
jgi:hypothetical protein